MPLIISCFFLNPLRSPLQKKVGICFRDQDNSQEGHDSTEYGEEPKILLLMNKYRTTDTHRQPSAWVTKPPLHCQLGSYEGCVNMTGPITGPRSGPIAKAAVAAPILSLGKTSDITPPPTLRTADPPSPANRRRIIKVAMELASAQPIWKTTKTMLPAVIMGFRPYSSDKGAKNLKGNDEIPKSESLGGREITTDQWHIRRWTLRLRKTQESQKLCQIPPWHME